MHRQLECHENGYQFVAGYLIFNLPSQYSALFIIIKNLSIEFNYLIYIYFIMTVIRKKLL